MTSDLIYRHPNPEFLQGLGAIAEFIGCTERDVKRAILKDGLPAIRLPEGQFFTSKRCVMAWILQGYEEAMEEKDNAKRARDRARDEGAPGDRQEALS